MGFFPLLWKVISHRNLALKPQCPSADLGLKPQCTSVALGPLQGLFTLQISEAQALRVLPKAACATADR